MAYNTFNPYKFDEQWPQQHPNCAACEEMLLDATEGLLSDADQAFFDQHLTGCVSCINSYAEAKRGHAFLALLKAQSPEPAADLADRIVDRILSRTLSDQAGAAQQLHPGLFAVPPHNVPVLPANVIPFAPRPAISGFTRFTRLAMEPHFAMTAAMAFFSIALTLSLTGVRLDQLHASDLNPLNLRRTYYAVNAQAVRYCDNLRVVRVLESRVDDIRQSQANDHFDNPRPSSAPAKQPEQQQPATQPQQKPEPHGTSRQDSTPLSTPHLQNTHFEITPDLLRRANNAAYALPSNKEGGLA
jgi:hypothetical protein